MNTDTDILVAGGGIAGLVATLSFARAGFQTLCIDPAPDSTLPDTRTTAFLQPSQELLESIGVWTLLSGHATPLQIMTIADLNDAGEIRANAAFDAAEISDLPFGWNLPNQEIRSALQNAISETPQANLLRGAKVSGFTVRDSGVRARLDDGQRLAARLLVAADGRNSSVRQVAGIPVKTLRYGQKAMVFTVTHDEPHNNTSTEVHSSGGPFTLVPLPSVGQTHQSSVVWMDKGPAIAKRMTISQEDLEAQVNARSGGVLGKLKIETAPRVWPIISQIANRIIDHRVALIAEAAHVVPPIGAQGLNMSLADIRALRDLAQTHELGSEAMLDAYSQARLPDMRARVTGIDALNRASISGAKPFRDLRGDLIGLLHRTRPVRRGLMRAGLGNSASP